MDSHRLIDVGHMYFLCYSVLSKTILYVTSLINMYWFGNSYDIFWLKWYGIYSFGIHTNLSIQGCEDRGR